MPKPESHTTKRPKSFGLCVLHASGNCEWYINWQDGSKNEGRKKTWEEASDILFGLLDKARERAKA